MIPTSATTSCGARLLSTVPEASTRRGGSPQVDERHSLTHALVIRS